MRTLAALTCAVVLPAMPALAHEGQPHDVAMPWTFDPWIVVPLSISAVVYALGAGHLAQRSELRRRGWEHACYAAGWLALAAALVSPLHPMGEVLFSAHMVQHEVMMLVAGPMLVLGRPLVPYWWGLPPAWRRVAGAVSKSRLVASLWRWMSRPVNAWWIHAATLWAWHAPVLFEETISSDLVHSLQHLSFLLSSLLFWWALIHGRDASMGYGMAVFYVFSTAVHSSILGALLTFSTRVWYPVYSQTTAKWGLTPIEDQQIGAALQRLSRGLIKTVAVPTGRSGEAEKHCLARGAERACFGRREQRIMATGSLLRHDQLTADHVHARALVCGERRDRGRIGAAVGGTVERTWRVTELGLWAEIWQGQHGFSGRTS